MFAELLDVVNTFLYSKLLIILLVGLGLYFTIRTKFVQFRLLGESYRVTKEKHTNKNRISLLESMLTSTAARVGTGNIIGVSTAICVGGYGAVFWMWVSALLGCATTFVESTLGQLYKKDGGDGGYYGGPSYYIEQATKQRWLGVLFAIATIMTYAGGFSMLPAYNLQSCYSVFSWYKEGVTPWIIGSIIAVASAICILGGSKRIVKFNKFLVPIMGGIYLLVAIGIFIFNIGSVPAVLGKIFSEAFDFTAIFGGFAGSCVMLGIKRGLLSNEAGMGSAPLAASSADTTHPVKSGLAQVLSVFIDTIIICTATAFMCLLSGVEPTASLKGAPYVQACIGNLFGVPGQVFIAMSVTLFGYTSILGNYFYVDSSLAYICKKWPSKTFLNAIHIIGCILVLIGSALSFGLVWDFADFTMGIMALINLPVLVFLLKPVLKALKNYEDQKKEGKVPSFKGADIGMNDLECWK